MIDDGWWPPLEIPDGKLTSYLLNVDHPKGGAKAQFFIAFGFHASRPQELGQALLDQFDALFGTDDMTFVQSEDGIRAVCEGSIAAPDGRRPRVRVIWQMQSFIAWRLITAVPLTR